MYLNDKERKILEDQANKIRKKIIETLEHAGSGHSAGPLGMADIFTALYFRILKHNPRDPHWADRDRVVLSNGHIVPVQYVAMAYAGYFPLSELKTLRQISSRLQGHPHRGSLPGIEVTGGPLGNGLGQAAGMALAARMDRKKHRIYCLLSDGEHQEGATWEAAMFIGKEKLSNLTGIIDRNNIQIDGYTENVMPLEPLKEKYEAFGWHVLEVDGHNFEQIISAVNEAKAITYQPTMIIAHTIPGKGVSFMEGKYEWHGKPPTKEQAQVALAELRTLGGKIQSEHE
ncbi:MAG: Transketolase domain protein [Parcubacteria group bacterium GW2011_GWA1_47_11]|uniref:Transketolase n=1 Tax=Candidatus Colwellbacteria bacterium GWA2_46_10 TaxID=1797684 RepID=A0A1G1YUS5_9BACT|nr:MAG: Transketolase domain protein [Parcubacteria group bacterium GW2011_GWA2_46_10]KKU55994.1 MAG: Transketolase domain protein [Parcubacteria group bacterium GW2011_GWA1_47_11]OGY56115.1 MAG: transketolase [Candidatus Colwellbacteria bacterium GWA2_46_10]